MAHEQRNGPAINHSMKLRMGSDCFQFGGEQECLAGPSVIQRLLSHTVTYQMQQSLFTIPDRNGEHAVETCDG